MLAVTYKNGLYDTTCVVKGLITEVYCWSKFIKAACFTKTHPVS